MYIGAKVRLASGGPEMLVVDLDPPTMRAMCAWRKSDGQLAEGWLNLFALDMVRRPHVVDLEGWRRRTRPSWY